MQIKELTLEDDLVLKIGLLRDTQVVGLLKEHHNDMLNHSPPESVHALDLTKLEDKSISFITLWKDNTLLTMGAYKQLDIAHVELKSMRTCEHAKNQGFAQVLLNEIIKLCRQNGVQRISLETGTAAAFEPAHRLYSKFGFIECPPFGDYQHDPYSQFMTYAINNSNT